MTLRAIHLFFLFIAAVWGQSTADELLREAEAGLSRGDYASTIEKGQAAIRLLEGGSQRSRLGAAVNAVGVAHLYKGDYADALPYFERAAALAKETGEPAAEVRRRNNIGNAYFYQGQYVKAFETYQTALARLTGFEQEPWYAGTRQLSLTNLAVLHQQLGQHQQALDLYREIRALPLQLKPAVEAQILTNLAIVYRRLGDPQKALETYRQARALLAADPNAAAALYTLHNVGVVQALDFGDYPGALRTFDEAVAIAVKSGSKRELVLERLFRGETLLRMGRAEASRADFDAALAAARELKLVDEVWTALYGLGRTRKPEALARYREAVEVIEAARSNLASASLKAEFLAGKRDVYDALIGELLDLRQPPVAEIFRRMEEGRARNLKELLPAERQAITIESLRAGLDGQTALLAFWTAGDRVAVLWLTQREAGVTHRRVTRPERFAELSGALQRKDSTAWEALAAELSPLLLEGVKPLSEASIARLVIVPDGSLHALPFEVLTHSGRRLVQQFAISYLPSAHFLRRGDHSPGRHWPWEVTAAAFANPLGGSGLFDAGWAPLPHAAQEARTITAVLPGREILFVGAEDLKQKATADATSRIPVLHFATHGAVDINDSRRSRLVFTPVEGDAASQYLFTNEIAKLHLNRVELVTLAACESERGRYVRGEGVENFSRAFLGAGAAATVSSLWRVSDRASADLMGEFYKGMADGLTKAESLRAAKLTMIERHPYYWAAYLLSGDGHSPLSPVIPWWPFAAAGVVVSLGVGWRKIR